MMRGAAYGSIGRADAPAEGTEGLYVADTRLLSRWILERAGTSGWSVGERLGARHVVDIEFWGCVRDRCTVR
jgi:hypothetical protein